LAHQQPEALVCINREPFLPQGNMVSLYARPLQIANLRLISGVE
jgi:hypothetical protein